MIDIERALTPGNKLPCRDEDTLYILTAKAHGLSWNALMELPYRILLRMNIMSQIGAKLGGKYGNSV